MNELYHYGVKGQKWGVRRYQYADGRLSSNSKKKQNKKKLSVGQKVAIGVGATAIVATGAYFAYKYYNMNADTMIKKGKEFQHMGRFAEDLSKPFYASHLKNDNKAYSSKKNALELRWTHQKTLSSSKDIKIAGKKITLETFSDWVKTSPVAKKNLGAITFSNKKDLKNSYYIFNRDLNLPGSDKKELREDFYSTMVNKGYDAIRDQVDQKYYGKTSPIIIFNGLDEIMTMKIKDITK